MAETSASKFQISFPMALELKFPNLVIRAVLAYHKMIPDCFTYIHTYIHNWPLQPFSQDYGQASHTTHVLCVNFLPKLRDLLFNVDSERQFFEKLFHVRFIYSQSFCQKAAERKSPKKLIFSLFRFGVWPGIRNRVLSLISQ